MAKITIYVDKIYYKDEEITNPKLIARVIKNHITHLGNIEVYYISPPKKWWKKILYYMTSGM